MSKRVLLVEDAAETRAIIRGLLEPEVLVATASTLEEAKQKIEESPYDLILLDVHLPDGEGFGFCAFLKEDLALSKTSVIFVTGKGEIDHKLRGFAVGGEDYLVKPFHPLELRARVTSVLQRQDEKRRKEKTMVMGALRLDLESITATVIDELGATSLELTPMEFKILAHFMKNEGRVLSREQLLQALWKDAEDVFDRTVDAHISKLRKRLQPASIAIEAVYGIGYRLILQRGVPV